MFFLFFFAFFSVSLYSVQNIAIHRIRLIFDSSNTLVYRDGPSWRIAVCDVIYYEVNKMNWTFLVSASLHLRQSLFPIVGFSSAKTLSSALS